MTEYSDLPPAKRLQLYRQLSADARKEAETATGTVRECYIRIAENWERLAAQLNPRKHVERRKQRRGMPDRRHK